MAASVFRVLHDPLALFCIVFLSVPALSCEWRASRQQARGTTFFGARVSPEFLASAEAAGIRTAFRRGIWLVTAAVILVFVLLAGRNPSDPTEFFAILIIASVTGDTAVFGLANRQTRRQAVLLPPPSVRTAVLGVEDDESDAWLAAIDWLGILLPIGIPLVTVAILVVGWNGYPADDRLGALGFASVVALVGLFPSATCYWLRFGARSSDWAPDPRASRRYRTVLGLMLSSTFAFIGFTACWVLLMPLLHQGSSSGMNTYFHISFDGFACLFVGDLEMRRYLKGHLSRESSDPMPDRCWKWGYFYYNPGDPAMVVPLRSGIGFSFNHACRAFWIVGAISMAVATAMFVWFFVNYPKLVM